MAEPIGSGGSVLVAGVGRRHSSRAAMIRIWLTALTAKGAARPTAVIRKPAMAGPIARLMLMPMEFRATAGCRCERGTSSGTTACQAGARKAAPVPIRKVNAISRVGVMRSMATRAARMLITTNRIRLTWISRRRLSTRSARVPASRANRNMGRVVAAWTSVTTAGDGFRVVISQPAPTSCIQVPMLETRPAVHSSAKAPMPNGAQAETGWALGVTLLAGVDTGDSGS